MAAVTVPEKAARLARQLQASRIVDRALQGLPGGERGAAAARGVSKATVHRYRDEEEARDFHLHDLLVDDELSRRVLADLQARLRKGDRFGDDHMLRLSKLLKEGSEHRQAWARLLGTHGDLSSVPDGELDALLREAEEDRAAVDQAVHALIDERKRRKARQQRETACGGPGLA